MDPRVLLVVLFVCSSGLWAAETHNQSETLRLVGETSRCAGEVELRHKGEWRPVDVSGWTQMFTASVCKQLECGSAVSTTSTRHHSDRPVWKINSDCVKSTSSLSDCVNVYDGYESSRGVALICSDSVRLMGPARCSGRLEVSTNQSWSSVCEGDFDQQDAEVVCRELGCGPPSVLQGALFGEAEVPLWSREFRCEGNESGLLDCGRSDSDTNTCSPDKAVGLTCSEPLRLVGEMSRCAGEVELKHNGEWRPMNVLGTWTQMSSASVCKQLDCGSAVLAKYTDHHSRRPVWVTHADCVKSTSSLSDCVRVDGGYITSRGLVVICSDSVRLMGPARCSGRLEVSTNQSWSSVCEGDFDQQDAEVVCRELGCGPPSVLQGALYGEAEAPLWSREFRCEGNESGLLDCGRSDSDTNTCSPDKAVGLTCSDPLRLVGETSRCAGEVELKLNGEWRPVYVGWTLMFAASVCKQLDCGSAVSTTHMDHHSVRPVWKIYSHCFQSTSSLSDCVMAEIDSKSSRGVSVICSDSVRLMGPARCSGKLEVSTNQSWSSVCEGDFDQQDAEVVCRELGCGPPSVLQGALYGEAEAPLWSREFRCEGNESGLLDCGRSDSDTNTCSPDKAVGLTCSEPLSVRLVGGTSRCAGAVEQKHKGEWRPVFVNGEWTQMSSASVCKQLECGSAVSSTSTDHHVHRPVWMMNSDCVQSTSSLSDCVMVDDGYYESSRGVEVICSGFKAQRI